MEITELIALLGGFTGLYAGMYILHGRLSKVEQKMLDICTFMLPKNKKS